MIGLLMADIGTKRNANIVSIVRLNQQTGIRPQFRFLKSQQPWEIQTANGYLQEGIMQNI